MGTQIIVSKEALEEKGVICTVESSHTYSHQDMCDEEVWVDRDRLVATFPSGREWHSYMKDSLLADANDWGDNRERLISDLTEVGIKEGPTGWKFV